MTYDEMMASTASARSQMAFQERMSNTAHQREVLDLKAAGLNPVLSAGGHGASTPSGASGDYSGVELGKLLSSTVNSTAKALDKALDALTNDDIKGNLNPILKDYFGSDYNAYDEKTNNPTLGRELIRIATDLNEKKDTRIFGIPVNNKTLARWMTNLGYWFTEREDETPARGTSAHKAYSKWQREHGDNAVGKNKYYNVGQSKRSKVSQKYITDTWAT